MELHYPMDLPSVSWTFEGPAAQCFWKSSQLSSLTVRRDYPLTRNVYDAPVTWAAVDIYYQNLCRSRFAGVRLAFVHSPFVVVFSSFLFLFFKKKKGKRQDLANFQESGWGSGIGADFWAAAEIDYQNSCQSRLSGVYLVSGVFQDTWRSNKENPSVYWGATLSCPLMASNCANSYLVPISFWSRSGCWPFLGIFYPISFYKRVSHFVVFQTKLAHLCFRIIRMKMPLLT